MKKISKHLISLAILALLVAPIFVLNANAQFDPGLNQVNTGLNNSLSNKDPRRGDRQNHYHGLRLLGRDCCRYRLDRRLQMDDRRR